MKRLEYDTIEIGFSELVQDLLSNYQTLTEWEKIDAKYTIRDLLVKKFSFLHDVSDVLLFTVDNEKIIAYGDEGYKLNFSADFQEPLLAEIKGKMAAPFGPRRIGKMKSTLSSGSLTTGMV